MEELVSTEALEREILEDARKKAERILKGADEDVRRIAQEGERRKAEAAAELQRNYAARAERYRAETLARVPLERARLKSSYVDARLREALGAFLSSLPESRVEAFAREGLRGAAAFLDGKELRIRRRSLSQSSATRAVAEALPASKVIESVEDPSMPAAGIVAETVDGSAIMRATLDITTETLLGQRRGELAGALCGEALSL